MSNAFVILSLIALMPITLWAQPKILVAKPTTQLKGLVIIAPAKKYLMEERLFSELSRQLSHRGFIVVRFNWSEDTLLDPNLELQRAARDIYKVVSESQRYFRIDSSSTVLISKSFSTKSLGLSLNLAMNHILLTPNCSKESTFASTYGSILKRPDLKMSIVISNEDPNCYVKQIYSALGQLANPISLFTTHGDHNFVTSQTQAFGKFSPFIYQDQVVQFVTIQALVNLIVK